MFDRPLLLWLMLIAPLAAIPGILAMRNGMQIAGAAAATLRMLCVIGIVLMLAGLRVPGRIAARSVGRLTPRSFARSRSGGSRSPGRNSPR